MDIIKSKSLRQIPDNTHYQGCTFYLYEHVLYHVENCFFENCSFRCDASFSCLQDSRFVNCNFSGKFTLNLKNVFEIPEYVFCFPFLTHLDVSYCELKEISCEIARLSCLRSLNVSYNNLVTLPKEIGQLHQLREINMSYNPIEQLPAEFANLPELRTVRFLGFNKEKFPETIFELLKLVELDIRESTSDSDLSSILENVKPSLTYLNISNNHLEEFPSQIFKLTNLKTLCLHNNNIKEIPDRIAELKSLEHFVVSKNLITNLPQSIVDLPLKTLDVQYNSLESLPPRLNSSLVKLRVNNNNLSFLPDLAKLQKLSLLDASNNKIQNLPQTMRYLTSLKELYLNSNELHNFFETTSGLPFLHTLDLSCNCLQEIPETVYRFGTLHFLDLSCNSIKVISRKIQSLKNIKYLDISNNLLECLPEEIKYLNYLATLKLNNNKLKNLPRKFYSHTLKHLHLQDNLLEKLTIENFSQLQSINLMGNALLQLPKQITEHKCLQHVYWGKPTVNNGSFQYCIWE